MRAWRPSLRCIVDWPGIGSGQRCVRPASPSSRGGLILLDDAGGDPAAVAQIDRVRGATAPEPEPLIRRSSAEIVVEDDDYRRRRHGLNAGNGLPRTVPLTCPAVINRDARVIRPAGAPTVSSGATLTGGRSERFSPGSRQSRRPDRIGNPGSPKAWARGSATGWLYPKTPAGWLLLARAQRAIWVT